MTDDRPSPRARDVPARAGGDAADCGTGPDPYLTVDEIADLAGGRVVRPSERRIRGGAVDSRLVTGGELFVALPGERTDGHAFLGDAARAGAAALLVSSVPAAGELEAIGDVGVVEAPDTLRGLQAVAAGWRTRFDPLVVGITGSIAKTSTKEAVATVLAADRTTLRSEGNQNNEIGLPLTVLRLGPQHAAAVLEMGMYVGGEIRDLAAIGRPRVGVVTAVLGVHLSRAGSLDAIEAAKAELVEALPPDGVAILNADDHRVRRMAARTVARSMTYGFADDADIGAEDVASSGLAGMRFTLRLPSAEPGAGARRLVASTPALGRLSVHNALAGAAVGVAAGIAPEAIVAALAAGWSAPHRGEIVRAGGVTIVDDAYNASPASVAAALELLGGLPGRRVAVLGEMLELGDGSDAGHREVGGVAAGVVDLLLVVGDGATRIADGARAAGADPDRVVRVPDAAAAVEELRRRLRPGDVVLVKASRGIALEAVVEGLVEALGPGSTRP